MNKETFIAIIENLKIDKITYFSIDYKEVNVKDEPIKTLRLEEN